MHQAQRAHAEEAQPDLIVQIVVEILRKQSKVIREHRKTLQVLTKRVEFLSLQVNQLQQALEQDDEMIDRE